jgi:hypothetical protein
MSVQRNLNIIGEIRRNLKERTGSGRYDITDLELYRMMNFVEDDILARLLIDVSFSIITQSGTEEYDIDAFASDLGSSDMIETFEYKAHFTCTYPNTVVIDKQSGFSPVITAAFDVNGDLEVTNTNGWDDATFVDPNWDSLEYEVQSDTVLKFYFSSLTGWTTDQVCAIRIQKENTN